MDLFLLIGLSGPYGPIFVNRTMDSHSKILVITWLDNSVWQLHSRIRQQGLNGVVIRKRVLRFRRYKTFLKCYHLDLSSSHLQRRLRNRAW